MTLTQGLMVFVADADLPELAKKYRADFKRDPDGWPDKADPTDFPSWLIAKGYALPVDYSAVHLGDYGEWPAELDEDEAERRAREAEGKEPTKP